MHGRLYDSALGQFMSADPIIQAPFSQGLNRFAYAFNSPLNYTDPSGFTAEASEDAAIGVGAGYFTGLVVHLLTSGGASGAAASGAAAGSVGAASTGAGAAVAGGGAAAAPVAAAAGFGAGVVTSVAMNIVATGRQPTTTTVSAPPSTRSATASGMGQTPVGHSGYSTMATSPVQEGRPPGMSLLDPERGAVACYPACLPNPNEAFPDTPAGRETASQYFTAYEVVGNAMLLVDGLWSLGGWALGRGAAEGVAAGLGRLGINATEFGAGKLVAFEQPGLVGFAQMQGNRLVAGIFSINTPGQGLRTLAQFRSEAFALGRSLGAKEVELVGAEFTNGPLREMLIRQGFTPGTMAAPEAIGGGTMNIVSKVFGL
jgi:hypothetical protein